MADTYKNTSSSDNGMYREAKPEKKSSKGWIVLGALVLAAIIIFGGTFVVTYENEYTLIKRFGKIDYIIDEPGLSFKIPFIQTAEKLPKEILIYDLAQSDVITKDKKTMVADLYVLWKITNPTSFVQTLNSQISNAEARINASVFNAMKNVISSLDQEEVIAGRGGALTEKIFANVGNTMDQYGIELINIEVKRLDLPDDNKQAVYERMISERNNIAAKYSAEGESEAQIIRTDTDYKIQISVSEAEAKAAQLIAEGEAGYMQKLAAAYNDEDKAEFYTFVLALDAAKSSLTGDNKTLILDPDSPIAQIFQNVE